MIDEKAGHERSNAGQEQSAGVVDIGSAFVPTVAAYLAEAYREGREYKPLLEVKRHPAQVPAPAVHPGGPFPEPGQVIIAVDPQVEQLERQVAELKDALWKIGARGHSEDCLFCGFKDAIAKEALDKP